MDNILSYICCITLLGPTMQVGVLIPEVRDPLVFETSQSPGEGSCSYYWYHLFHTMFKYHDMLISWSYLFYQMFHAPTQTAGLRLNLSQSFAMCATSVTPSSAALNKGVWQSTGLRCLFVRFLKALQYAPHIGLPPSRSHVEELFPTSCLPAWLISRGSGLENILFNKFIELLCLLHLQILLALL